MQNENLDPKSVAPSEPKSDTQPSEAERKLGELLRVRTTIRAGKRMCW